MPGSPSTSAGHDLQRTVEQVSAVMRHQGLAAAHAIAKASLDSGSEHPFLLKVDGLWLHENGQYRAALRAFHHANELAPGDPMTLNCIAGTLGAMGELKAALQIIEESLKSSATIATTHYLHGWCRDNNREWAKARQAYERCLQIAPQHLQALAGLAAISAETEEFAAARSQAESVLARAPNEPTATIALCMADIADGNHQAAQTRLRALLRSTPLADRPRAIASGLLGDVLDAEGRFDEAFESYEAENTAWRAILENREMREQPLSETLNTLAHNLEATTGKWTPAATSTDHNRGTHIFIMGFPRSGTTLLEQILASHPDVVAMEETDLLEGGAAKYLGSAEAIEQLLHATDADLDTLRSAYWKAAEDRKGDLRGKVFIDKLPLHTPKLPLISRLFPQAKILFAVRDPRDVVLSNFRRRLQVRADNYELQSLQGIAGVYDGTMRIGAWSRKNLPMAIRVHRHESLLEDFDAEVKRLCDFSGIAVQPAMKDFAAMRDRNVVSLSAPQIRRGLNSEGVGKWRDYAGKLSPVLPLLSPWIEEFGYAPN